jgi:predicted TIM-barrel fold metal-dependent hydrolase
MYKLFSVDDHIMEPAHLWTSRVAQKFQGRAPHVIEDPETGVTDWTWEGGHRVSTGLYAVAGKPPEEWGGQVPIGFKDMIPGCYDPKQRAKDFLSNGIYATAAFPTLAGFGGTTFASFEDKELASACVEAYNDFIIDEWCTSGPKGLFVPMIIGKTWDVDGTVKEMERCAKKGAVSIAWMENPHGMGMPSYWTDHWDRFWACAQDLDFPVCMHIGTGGTIPMPSPEAPDTLFISLSYVAAMSASMNLAMSQVCRKFDKLKLVFSEGGLGWLPAAMERADFQWTKHGAWTKLTGTLPSEIIKKNMYFCMIQEPWAFHSKDVRDAVGEDHIFWECDYPHADTPWPNTQFWAKEMFDGVDPAVSEKAQYKNAERVFNWKICDPAEAQKVLETA